MEIDLPLELPKARPYQEELLATAKEKNSLICLGTGAGKTYIAVMLISHFSHELEPSYDEDGKRTFFLVPTRPLVKQQAAEIVKKSRFGEGDVGEYTGDMNVDFWSKNVWLEHLRTKKVFVMTRQIFLNMLNSATIPVSKVNLLIFDEAHHAAPKSKKPGKGTNDCYKLIMDFIHSRPESDHPRILGLSASLINANSNAETLQRTIRDLEGTYKSSCTSVTDLDDVRKYATDPVESIWEYTSDSAAIGFDCTHIQEFLLSARDVFLEMDAYKTDLNRKNESNRTEQNIDEIPTNFMAITLPISVDALKKCEYMISDILQSMGPWCAIAACDFYIQEFQSYIELYENSYPGFCSILKTVNDMIETVVGLLKYSLYIQRVSLNDLLLKYTSNKMQRLLALLMQYSDPNKPLAGIIFVQRRAICKALCKWLQKIKEVNLKEAKNQFNFLKTDYIVGEAARPGFANKIAVKAAQLQKKTLNKFRSGDLNILVSTSILEEGLDVSQCNLVVRYDGVDSFRRWVQSQGRARSKDGRFVVFSNSPSETQQSLDNFKGMFKELQTLATSRKHKNPSSVYHTPGNIPEDEMPLINPVNGARITLDTAKAMVFMYCSRLPSDAFFSTNPYETKIEHPNGFQFVIRLPINSPIKSAMKGPVKLTESLACKAAYLEVCRILREEDEIDESFVPYTKTARLKRIIDEFNLTCSIDDDETYIDGPKPGTVKRRQVYSKSFETMFASLPIKSSTTICLYSIDVQPKTGRNSIGFICSEDVPLSRIVSSFPVYIKTAEYKISVASCDTAFYLSPEQLHQVQLFHQVVFHESLGFKRKQFKFDDSSPVYVVPLTNEFGVDWNMVQVTLDRNNTNAAIISKNDAYQQHFTFNESVYNDAMVFRRYELFGLFEVLKVSTKTPSSRFPNNDNGYTTYEDYFDKKYGLTIIHTHPLLCVNPIGFNSSIKQVAPTKAEQKRKPIELVPELLLIFPIPTSFHRQCRLLPAIFYRLCQFYNIEILRERIATEANFGWQTANHNWGPLNVESVQSICREEKVVQRDSAKNSDSDANGDDSERSMDSDEMKVDTSFQMDEDMGSTHSQPEDIYGDVDELKRKYSNFNVITYAYSMKQKLMNEYKKFLEAPVVDYDLGDHSQYLPKNSEIQRNHFVDFERVKSFDRHTRADVFGPSPSLILQALTTNKANDMFNMERLETLGDSFLKLTTSAYFYYKLPVLNEGYLSSLKVNQISNRNLYRLGSKKDLAEFVVAHQFQPSNNWLPPGFSANIDTSEKKEKKDGESYNKYTEQRISDKSIADCCESLIGAYLLSSGPMGAVNFMTWLGIRIVDPLSADNNGHWLPSPRSPKSISTSGDPEIKIKNLSSTLTEFEERIGYNFRDKCFLIQAMTHVSYHDNTVTDCYQRLEFLGDAVLDYLITRYIYEDPNRFKPGDLTQLRASLTNNAFFGSLAVKHRFHVHLKMSSYDLYRSIHSFADKIKTDAKDDIVFGNFMTLLDERETQDSDETEVPKALGDVFEAVAGGIYLDSNYSLDAVWRVYYPLMASELENFSKNIPKSPLSLLYMKYPSVTFSDAVAVNKRQVSVTVTVKYKGGTFTEDGYGKNRYWARSSAAKRALRRKI
ncbi:hypothetical protein HA402_005974 [Bradysia odoriphaga]|nr:hypothetical protein HA402_005974 [Bradysia odoriphaga]